MLADQDRTKLLLRLMVACRRGQADEQLRTERVDQYLIAQDGVAPEQRPLVLPAGTRTLWTRSGSCCASPPMVSWAEGPGLASEHAQGVNARTDATAHVSWSSGLSSVSVAVSPGCTVFEEYCSVSSSPSRLMSTDTV